MKIAAVGNGAFLEQLMGFLNPSIQCTVVYFDDYHLINNQTHFPFLNWKDELFNDYKFIVGLGYKNLAVKKKIIFDLINLQRDLISFSHPSSFIHNSAKVGKAVFIYPMCNIDRNVVLKDGVILNNSTTIAHDTIIGDSTYVSPGVTISGRVKIGVNCFIGAGTTISNDLVIGDNVIIGIGSVVTSDLPNNVNVIGNPLKWLSNPLILK
jgi:sugar O-acyltransferase (sialic acid O-acetyltransferase NeuD family)